MSRMILRRIRPPFNAFETPFTASGSFTVPANSSKIALVGVGGGGGGSNGGFPLNGDGGDPGVFAGRILVVGVDIAVGAVITITIGTGGAGAANVGKTGVATTFKWNNMSGVAQTLTCNPGAGGSGSDQTGYGPGTYTFDGRNYVGGGNVSSGAGAVPGGGGAGGASFGGGGQTGARGQGWAYAA